MLNGMGRDRGASMILDQVILPTTTTSDRRTTVFAAYNVVQDAGHALGALLAAVPALIRALAPVGEIASLRMAVELLPAPPRHGGLYRTLSPAVEAGRRARARLSPETGRSSPHLRPVHARQPGRRIPHDRAPRSSSTSGST
jgi:hypothetical protein